MRASPRREIGHSKCQLEVSAARLEPSDWSHSAPADVFSSSSSSAVILMRTRVRRSWMWWLFQPTRALHALQPVRLFHSTIDSLADRQSERPTDRPADWLPSVWPLCPPQGRLEVAGPTGGFRCREERLLYEWGARVAGLDACNGWPTGQPTEQARWWANEGEWNEQRWQDCCV